MDASGYAQRDGGFPGSTCSLEERIYLLLEIRGLRYRGDARSSTIFNSPIESTQASMLIGLILYTDW